MANIQLPNATFKDWAKDPKTAMLILMASLLVVFVYAFTHASNSRVDDCKDQVDYLRKELSDMAVTIMQPNIGSDTLGVNRTVYLMDSLLRANTKGAEKLLTK